METLPRANVVFTRAKKEYLTSLLLADRQWKGR
jgi:hypothetical protein